MAETPSRKAPPLADAAVVNDRRSSATTTSLSALREQAEGLRRAQVMANLAHVVTAPDGSFETWSETLPDLIGVKPADIARSTRRWLDLVHPDDRARFRETALAARADRKRRDIEYRLWRSDGTWIHVRQVMEPIEAPPPAGGALRWFNTLQDITAQKSAEDRIRRLNRVYAVLSGINSLIVRVKSPDELFHAACELLVQQGSLRIAWVGLVDESGTRIEVKASAGDVEGFFESARLSLVEGAADFGLAGQVLRTLKPAIAHELGSSNSLRKREYRDRDIKSLCIMPLIVAGKGFGVLALYAGQAGFFDDDEMRLLQELAGDIAFAIDTIHKSNQAAYLAFYDPLTGLVNRTLFYERLEQGVRATKEGRQFSLTLVDLERFRTINDTLGRQAGDDLLRQVAARLKEQAGNEGWTARMGGDVFAVAVPDVASAEELASRTALPLREIFARPYLVGGEELRVGGRLGIALYPDNARDAEELVRNAEAALKKAKASGERYLFYEQRMAERVSERLSLENQLRRALEDDEFVLHYQPKVELESRAIVGLEALLRWQSPQLGLVPPMKFIQILEETGLILEVGSWALKRAALDHRSWTEQGVHAPRVAVNVSAIQLRQRGFVRNLEEAIVLGVTPTGIDVELTESLVMDDIEANIEKLKAIRALGLDVAIDDFGTGYSSLAYLAKLPVQALKIDRSFIKAMHDDPNAMTLVSTMINLAHSLRLKVIAEGVETEEQAKILRLLRCDQMQGYLVAKPLPAADIVRLLS
jgi:diguanylate cyclase (GGDEF)-like protein/PAS domain S-box-containing protein